MNKPLKRNDALALSHGTKVWVECNKENILNNPDEFADNVSKIDLSEWDGVHIRLDESFNHMDHVVRQIKPNLALGLAWNLESWYGEFYRVWEIPEKPTSEELTQNPW